MYESDLGGTLILLLPRRWTGFSSYCLIKFDVLNKFYNLDRWPPTDSSEEDDKPAYNFSRSASAATPLQLKTALLGPGTICTECAL